MDVEEASAKGADAGAAAPSVSLDPWKYQAWVRSLQRKMLAAEDDAARLSLAAQLCAAYAETAANLAMDPHDWHIYLGVSLAQQRSSGADMDALLALHEQSTQDYLDMGLFVRCATLRVILFALHTGVEVPLYGDDAARGPATDLVHSWTGLQWAPRVDAHGAYISAEELGALVPNVRDAALADVLGEEATRSALRALYARCAWHVEESARVWDVYLAFEQALLASERTEARVDAVLQTYTARLRVPHRTLDATFQAFSSFVTAHLPADAYEETLAAANKHQAASARMWQEREAYEDAVAHPEATLETHWVPYLSWETHHLKRLRVAKDKTLLATEEELAQTLYRRAIARFARFPRARNAAEEAEYHTQPPTAELERAWKKRGGRKSHKMLAREESEARVELRARLAPAETLWLDYAALVGGPYAEEAALMHVCTSGVRSLPSSGRLWALYLRSLVRFQHADAQVDTAYERALHGGVVAEVGGGAALIALLQARIDAERALATWHAAMEQGVPVEEVQLVANLDRFMQVYERLVRALGIAAELPPEERDAQLTLEKYTVDWVQRAVRALFAVDAEAAGSLHPLAEQVWDAALQQQPNNANAYLEAALYWKQRDDDRRARQLFRTGAGKHGVENKGPLLAAWVTFEHERGSVQDVDYAEMRSKIEEERIWRAWYSQMQRGAEAPSGGAPSGGAAAPVPSTEGPAEAVPTGAPAAPAAAGPAASTGSKRKVEETMEVDAGAPVADAGASDATDATKKGRTAPPEAPARDREYSSVIASRLPADVTADEVRAFFRECGAILEIAGPRTVAERTEEGEETSAALVEFADRAAAGAAHTRTLKRVRGFEVLVSPSQQCTLYVTNFPPDADDAAIRERFGRYGAIFDVRWPSRKFMHSRRFCYVQYVQPAYAQAALAEHGAHWHGDHPLSVLLSNPAHRKQRTDANANDKELFVSGLPRGATAEELRALFEAHAPVRDVRMPQRPDGKSRGIAFLDFATPLDARRAMHATNGAAFHGRTLAVVLAQAGRHGRPEASPDTGRHARSVRVAGLPPDAQEALIQQAVEKALGPGSVKRVFWTPGREPHGELCDSLVEFNDEATAGRALLGASATYGDAYPLTFEAHAPRRHEASESFVPRAARAARGLGTFAPRAAHTATEAPAPTRPKGQDQFREMLRRGPPK